MTVTVICKRVLLLFVFVNRSYLTANSTISRPTPENVDTVLDSTGSVEESGQSQASGITETSSQLSAQHLDSQSVEHTEEEGDVNSSQPEVQEKDL